MPSPSRRQFLATLGAAGLASTAGCVTYDRPSHEGRWPPETNRYVTDVSGPGSDAYIAWSREMRDAFPPTMPVVADGTVYHLDSREARREQSGGTWLGAFDAKTGETQWETRLWETDEFYYLYHQGPPVFDGDRLFAQTHDGVKAVSTDGELLWTFQNLGPHQPLPDYASPVVTDDLVVAGSYGTEDSDHPEVLYGIDRQSGERVWKQSVADFDGGSLWRLTLDGDTCYAPLSSDGRVLALDATTGEPIETYDAGPIGAVSISDNQLLVLSEHGQEERLYSFDVATGAQQWSVDLNAGMLEGTVVTDGTRLYHNEFRYLVARRLDTGEEVWRVGGTDDRYIHQSTPVIAADNLYVSAYRSLGENEGDGSFLLVLDPETGTEVGRIIPWNDGTPDTSTPAVADGALYLSHSYGELVCFEDCAAGVFDHCLIG
ncbi:PQQ-binding-like beta-propeller repeat protein [Haloferax larsenii]|nr:PQQ-binding-like beta-propeller repeat protein [Haloferax larsenii]